MGQIVRTIATLMAIAALGVSLAACVTDGDSSGTAYTSQHQMRYYGGPKSPMWPEQ